jgi:hypothetical protein
MCHSWKHLATVLRFAPKAQKYFRQLKVPVREAA